MSTKKRLLLEMYYPGEFKSRLTITLVEVNPDVLQDGI
ncbi:hypothetical protein HG15A2_23680 [Adhaeretor mobilis]|uniref:Uncharacterized protein n=1 Tax=Adhaeretor mobilis TaxID=1930276 RepID=A0A517MW31_9BACT|nr:hypothetical protein HG15A2_23680 [Adhaeretor mobilis]